MNFIKTYFLATLAIFSVMAAHAQTAKKQPVKSRTSQVQKAKPQTAVQTVTLKNGRDTLSYALGMDLARMLKSTGFDVNLNMLSQALNTAYQGGNTLFSEAQKDNVIQQNLSAAREKKSAELRKSGEAFLATVRNNPAVKSTPEGILYEVLVQGEGPQPSRTDEVKVHYAGYLPDGKKFDSSYDRGQPLNLSLEQVIEGWRIALPMMKVGSKYKLYIPYNLAYGERETGIIPAFSPLVFEIELLDVVKPDAVQ